MQLLCNKYTGGILREIQNSPALHTALEDIRKTAKKHLFRGQGQKPTYINNIQSSLNLIMILPGNNAKLARVAMSGLFKRFFAGDPSLVSDLVQNNQSNDPLRQIMREDLGMAAVQPSLDGGYPALDTDEGSAALSHKRKFAGSIDDLLNPAKTGSVGDVSHDVQMKALDVVIEVEREKTKQIQEAERGKIKQEEIKVLQIQEQAKLEQERAKTEQEKTKQLDRQIEIKKLDLAFQYPGTYPTGPDARFPSG